MNIFRKITLHAEIENFFGCTPVNIHQMIEWCDERKIKTIRKDNADAFAFKMQWLTGASKYASKRGEAGQWQ